MNCHHDWTEKIGDAMERWWDTEVFLCSEIDGTRLPLEDLVEQLKEEQIEGGLGLWIWPAGLIHPVQLIRLDPAAYEAEDWYQFLAIDDGETIARPLQQGDVIGDARIMVNEGVRRHADADNVLFLALHGPGPKPRGWTWSGDGGSGITCSVEVEA